MTRANFDCTIETTFDNLWKVLLEEIESPDKFSATIQQTRIIERFHNGVLRSVTIPDAEVREKIVYDYQNRMLTTQLVGHPELVGEIQQKITDNGSSQKVSCEILWKTEDERIAKMLMRNVGDFVAKRLEKIKEVAEEPRP